MSSLTSPNDRENNPLEIQRNAPVLEGYELQNAVTDLSDNNFLKKYPRLERVFADPRYSKSTILSRIIRSV